MRASWPEVRRGDKKTVAVSAHEEESSSRISRRRQAETRGASRVCGRLCPPRVGSADCTLAKRWFVDSFRDSVTGRGGLARLRATRSRRTRLDQTRNPRVSRGVVDSDGNLRIEKKRVRDMLGPNYRINIRCAQVVPSPALELFAKTFGGRLAVRKSQSPNERDLVSWSLHDRAAMRAVEALALYVIVKLAEANLLLDLRRLKAEGKHGETEWVHANRWRDSVKMRKRCYTSEQVAAFERIYRAVQALHSAAPNSYRLVPAAGLTENSRKSSDLPR